MEQKHDTGPDIIGSIISARAQPGSVQEVSSALSGESNVVLVAGNDTITTTLVFSATNSRAILII